jgi:hypothetical protein
MNFDAGFKIGVSRAILSDMACVTLVDVFQPDAIGKHVYAAAVDRSQAVEAVLKQMPAGWVAELANHQLNEGQIASLNLNPGDVIEYSPGLSRGANDDRVS